VGAPAALSTSNAGGRRLPLLLHCKGAAPAATGSNDSCSSCGATSSLQQQRCSAAPQVVQPDNIASTSFAARQAAGNGISGRSRQQQNSIVPCTGTSSRPIGGGSNCSSLEQLGHLGDEQLTGAAIMQQLKAATTWQELQDLVLQHSSLLNWRHSCAAITHAAQLLPQQGLQLQGHQQMHHPRLPGQQQQQEQDWQQQPLPLTTGQPQQQQSQLGTASQTLPEQGSIRQQQQLSSSRQSRRPSTGVDAAAGAQHFLQLSLIPLINSHLQAYDARGLANCLWALAKLQAVAQPPSTWLQQFCSTSEPLLQQFDAQQLSNTLWGLVQLQHPPPESWMQGWYAAMLQACSLEDPSWQPQSVSSALWSLAQLYGSSEHAGSSSRSRSKASSSSSSSRCGPSAQWVDQVLAAAMQRVMQRATNSSNRGSSKGKQQCGSGQVVSNVLWACVQLQHQPKQEFLLALNSWLQGVAAEGAAAAAAAAASQQRQLSDQSLANCLWALGKLQQQQQQQQGGGVQRQHRRQLHPVICQSGQLLLQLSTHRLGSTSNQHLSNMVWGAGALHLLVRAPVVSAVMQQLVARAGSLTDQQVANLMWGLSHIRQRSAQAQQSLPQVEQQQPAQTQQVQQQQIQQQQQQHAECIEHLLSVQAGRMHSFSSQAIGSTLLSLVRMRHHPSQDTLRAWLEPLARKPPGSSSEVIALVDACCALALLRQQQTPAGSRATSSSGQQYGNSSQWQQRVQMLGPYSSADAQWLSTVCDVTVSRLGSFTADQLCGLGWALALLRFRAPVPWLTAWQLAVADKASTMTAAVAARVLYVMQELPGAAVLSTTGMGAAQSRLADAAVAGTLAAAAAGHVAAYDVAAAASCMRAGRTTGGMQSMGKLLEVLPAVLSSCSIRQLAVVLSAAAATQAPLQPGLLPSVLQQVQQQQQQGRRQRQHCSSTCHLLVAVAKVSKQQHFYWQQQQQQTVSVTTEADAGLHQQQQDPQQQGSSGLQLQQEQQALLDWLQHSVPQLPLGRASAAELSMVLWALAVLCFHPGRSWLDSWVQHSSSLLQQMAPQQLASCGWALSVLRHRPEPQWLASWSQAVAQHAASGAAAPRTLSLLLYSSAVLGCPVSTSWLRSVGLQAARQAEAWGPADVADGLWGLGQLGLRAAAEEELLEVLTERLVAATAGAGQLQQLGPYRQLQVLQAAVLLGPGPLAYQQQQQQQSGRQAKRLQVSSRQGKRKQKLRWLRFRVLTSAATARQAAAAATADAQSASSSGSSMDGGAGPSRELLAATMGKAAVVSAKYVMAKTGRDPAAGATGPLKPAWFAYWCRCSLQTLAQWRPQQVAAALGAFAALQWPPPLAWQQQMLSQAVQQGGLSVQTATAIQDALVALQSPLVKTWRGPLAVQYIPTAPSSSASSQQQQQQQQQQEPAALPAVLPRQQQQLQQDPAVVKGVVRSSEPRYPHHLRGNTMRWLYRKQRLMRLVGWWRQQQAIQQQYAQQRQQQQLEETWQAAAAAQAGTSPAPSSPWSSYESSSYGYSSGSSGATPSSSVEGAGAAIPARSPPRTPARQLDGSAWGKQLVRPPARPAASADVPGPSTIPGSSQASSTTDGSGRESSSAGGQASAADAAGSFSGAGGAAAESGDGGALPAQAAAEQTDSQQQTSATPASRISNGGSSSDSTAVAATAAAAV